MCLINQFIERNSNNFQKHIEEASEVLSKACETLDQFRRKTGIVERIMSSSSNGGSSAYDSW